MTKLLATLMALRTRTEVIQQELNSLVVQLEQEESEKEERGIYLAGSYLGTCWKKKPNTWPPEGEGDTF
jgi:hypothetical protein